MCECPLSSALRLGLPGLGGTPLNLAVTITPSDEVTSLRSRIASLEAELSELQTSFNRTQYLYMCEVQLNLQLQDLMRAHRISFPRRLCTSGVVPAGFSEFLARSALADSEASG